MCFKLCAKSSRNDYKSNDEILNMGGYAAFVWPAYFLLGLTFF